MKRTVVVGVLNIVFAILVMMPATLWAQEKETPLTSQKPYYGMLKLGAYLPESSDLSNQNAGNGFSGQVAFGYYPVPYFAVEAGFGYFETKGTVSNVDRKFNSWPLEISGRLALPMRFLEPYLLGGIGVYFSRAEVGGVGKDSEQFGYFGGGGLNLNLGKSFFIGAEARYLVLEIPVLQVNPLGTTSQSNIHLDGVIATANLGYRF